MIVDYFFHVLIVILIFGMVSLSLIVSSGFTQLVSLTHAGFFGVGAYTSAILSQQYGLAMWVNLPLAMLLTGAIATLFSIAALRTVDDYFVISSLGAGVLLFAAMNNWTELTHGPLGIPGIPTASILGHDLVSKWEWLSLVGVFYLLVFVIVWKVSRSPFRLLLVGISEDEVYCQSLGRNVYRAKLTSFVFGSALAAIPGVLYAHYISFIDPTSFSIHESIFILSIIIIGGSESLIGSLLATAFLILAPEVLRFLGLPSGLAANIRQILFSVALVIVLAWRQFRTV